MTTRLVGATPVVAVSEGGTGLSTTGAPLEVLRTNALGSALEWGTAGTGDVVGPAGATDNALTRFDTNTGKLIQNSTVVLDDTGNMTFPDDGTIRSNTNASDALKLSAYDTLNLAYVDFMTLTSNNPPSCAWSNISISNVSITSGTISGISGISVAAGNVGFFGAAAVAQQTSGANLTNNVTPGGVDNTIADYTDLVVYANDAAAIRDNIYQLARKQKQINDALRLYGLLS